MSSGNRTILRTGAVVATALAALMAAANGEAFASPGCDAVNAGGFNDAIGPGGSDTKTIAGFAVGDKINFTIKALGGVQKWTLKSGNGTTVNSFSTGLGVTQMESYGVTGNKQDTTLSQTIVADILASGMSVTATCTATAAKASASTNSDSSKLSAMQMSVMPIVAQVSGQAITGAIFDAIGVGFTGNPAPFTPNGSGFTYYFGADPRMQRSASDQDSVNRFLASPDGSGRQLEDRFAALGFAGPTKAPPLTTAPTTVAPRDWLAWFDVRGTEFDRDTTTDLNGTQVNAIAGLTRRFTPDFLVGVLGGYEHFDYSSQALAGTLKGDGWTAGGFLGWRFAPNLRFDAAGAWTDILANDTAGRATGRFTGNRWLVSGGVTGTYGWQAWVFEPSARAYALWEHDNAFIDSLGTAQPAENFATGRAAAGLQVSYPFVWASALSLAPYAGLYGDYYFSSNDTAGLVITTVPLLQGFGVRTTGGITATVAGGAQLSAGGEFEEVGHATQIWTWRVRGYLPF